MPDLHTIAIVIHAVSATAAFIVGIVLISQRDTLRQLQLSVAFLVLLILMEVFLVTAFLSHVTSLPLITQIIFAGLAVLGLYMNDLARGSSLVSPAGPGRKSRSGH